MPPNFHGSRGDLDPSLLTPSLSGSRAARPIFSSRAGFWVAFLGGMYASAIFGAANLVRMRRVGRDAWICVAGAALWSVALLWFAAVNAHPERAPAWLGLLGIRPAIRLAGRGGGMLLFAVLYARQRPFYRAQRLLGDAPNPWPLGVASCAAAVALELALIAGALA